MSFPSSVCHLLYLSCFDRTTSTLRFDSNKNWQCRDILSTWLRRVHAIIFCQNSFCQLCAPLISLGTLEKKRENSMMSEMSRETSWSSGWSVINVKLFGYFKLLLRMEKTSNIGGAVKDGINTPRRWRWERDRAITNPSHYKGLVTISGVSSNKWMEIGLSS